MNVAPETARFTAPMSPLPPMPPPVLVAMVMASDIQLNSPASDTIDSPAWSDSSSTGIVVPWIVSSMVTSSSGVPILPSERPAPVVPGQVGPGQVGPGQVGSDGPSGPSNSTSEDTTPCPGPWAPRTSRSARVTSVSPSAIPKRSPSTKLVRKTSQIFS